jgi:hypothetical protein
MGRSACLLFLSLELNICVMRQIWALTTSTVMVNGSERSLYINKTTDEMRIKKMALKNGVRKAVYVKLHRSLQLGGNSAASELVEEDTKLKSRMQSLIKTDTRTRTGEYLHHFEPRLIDDKMSYRESAQDVVGEYPGLYASALTSVLNAADDYFKKGRPIWDQNGVQYPPESGVQYPPESDGIYLCNRRCKGLNHVFAIIFHKTAKLVHICVYDPIQYLKSGNGEKPPEEYRCSGLQAVRAWASAQQTKDCAWQVLDLSMFCLRKDNGDLRCPQYYFDTNWCNCLSSYFVCMCFKHRHLFKRIHDTNPGSAPFLSLMSMIMSDTLVIPRIKFAQAREHTDPHSIFFRLVMTHFWLGCRRLYIKKLEADSVDRIGTLISTERVDLENINAVHRGLLEHIGIDTSDR